MIGLNSAQALEEAERCLRCDIRENQHHHRVLELVEA